MKIDLATMHTCSDLPMSPMHSLISFMDYLSSWEFTLSSLKSHTSRTLASFLGTMNNGLLYLDLLGWIRPCFNHSWTWSTKIPLCTSIKEIAFCRLDPVFFVSILCSKWFAQPKSFLLVQKTNIKILSNQIFICLCRHFDIWVCQKSTLTLSDIGFGSGAFLEKSFLTFSLSIIEMF